MQFSPVQEVELTLTPETQFECPLVCADPRVKNFPLVKNPPVVGKAANGILNPDNGQ